MPRQALLPFLGVSIISGSVWLFIKIGLGYFPPFLFVALRVAIAALAMGGYLIWARSRLPRTWADAWPAVLYGVLEAGGYLFVFWGELYIPSGIGSVLTAMTALFVVFLSVPLLGRRLDLRSVGSAALGVAGVLLATTTIHGAGFSGTDTQRYLGLGALILTAAFYAGSTVLGKKYIREPDPAVTSFIQLLTMAVLLLALSAVIEPVTTPIRLTFTSVAVLAYLSLVGTALSFGLYFVCMDRMGASELSLVTVVNPIVAIAMGTAFLGESMGWRVVLGTLCVLGAVVWMSGVRLTRRRGHPGSGGGPEGAGSLAVAESHES